MKRHCAAATGEEGQLLEHNENPPHFLLWQKIKLVVGGVFVGLVAFVLSVIEIEENLPKEQLNSVSDVFFFTFVPCILILFILFTN